jgi:hypothetical protein
MDGQARCDESLVNLPNWLPLKLRADDNGPCSRRTPGRVIHHHARLDLRRRVAAA